MQPPDITQITVLREDAGYSEQRSETGQ